MNFDGVSDGTSASAYGFVNHNLNGITWTGVEMIIPTTPLAADWFNGVRSLRSRGYGASDITMTSDKTNGIGVISFDYRRYGTDGQTDHMVEYSTDGGTTWTQAGANFLGTGTVQTFSTTLNITGNVRVRIRTVTALGTTNRRLNIDDLLITDFLGTAPTIVATPASLSGFFYVVGNGPSNEQTFTASGTNLTNDITISAPTNYEIAVAAGGPFSNSITLTQTAGTVPATTIYVRLIAGLPVNAYNAEVITLASAGATSQSVTCNGNVVNPSTVFTPGDFAVIALNSNINCYPPGPNGAYSDGDDEISFITFKDIVNGDSFYMTDNGYERVNAGLWGDTEGVYFFTRTGATIPAGTVITFRFLNTTPFVEFNSPDNNWTFNKVAGFGGNLVMNSGGDQVFFMQGGAWTNPAAAHDASYAGGEFIYAFNTNSAWNPFINSTQQSGLPISLNCFNLMPGSATDFLEYTGPTTPATKLDWIVRLNNPTNWTNRVNCLGYLQTHVGQTYTVLTGGVYIDGVWVGSKNTDWFDCANWQTLQVPDNTIDVSINNTFAIRDANIDITSPLAPIYSNIAISNNIEITDRRLIIEANPNNRLDVFGNLTIGGTGVLDMDDNNNATEDGTINLYGNWTNNLTETAFEEGNGKVRFVGTTDQIINNVAPFGTEVFYNVDIDNNFTTSISNNLIATGNLEVYPSRTVTVNALNYIQVNNNLTVNGTFNVLDDGSLIQVNDAGVNIGTISYQRNTTANTNDYVYWSSPVNTVNTPTGFIYTWDADIPNSNGGEGNWVGAANVPMLSGVGYIMRNIFSRNFIGVPRNGVIQPAINRGTYTGPDYLGTNGTTITRFSDNWNLVGNPYPSSIDAVDFINLNTNIEGAVRLWTHATPVSTAIPNSFYGSFSANYTPNDYITYNALGTVSGPAGFNGFIAGGQSFLVNMLDGAPTTETVTFNNSLRSRSYDNSQFYRTANRNENNTLSNERHRLWLDISNTNAISDRTLIGYTTNATLEKDRTFDAVIGVKPGVLKIYSLIGTDKMTIQGRPVPFDDKDKVKIGFNVPAPGSYTLAIAAADGLLEENQEIYVEDLELNFTHNLRLAPYYFHANNAGENNNRFIIKYKLENKSNEDDITNNEVLIFNNNSGININ
ncbi:hypothetical protein DPN68_12850, partial [Flavobacterium tibetense]